MDRGFKRGLYLLIALGVLVMGYVVFGLGVSNTTSTTSAPAKKVTSSKKKVRSQPVQSAPTVTAKSSATTPATSPATHWSQKELTALEATALKAQSSSPTATALAWRKAYDLLQYPVLYQLSTSSEKSYLKRHLISRNQSVLKEHWQVKKTTLIVVSKTSSSATIKTNSIFSNKAGDKQQMVQIWLVFRSGKWYVNGHSTGYVTNAGK